MCKKYLFLIIVSLSLNIMCYSNDTIYSENRTYALRYQSCNKEDSREESFYVYKKKDTQYKLINNYKIPIGDSFSFYSEIENYDYFITNDGQYIIVEVKTKPFYEGVILYWVIYKIEGNTITPLRIGRRRFSLKLTDFIKLIPRDRDRFTKEYKEKYLFQPPLEHSDFNVNSNIEESTLCISLRYYDGIKGQYIEDKLKIPFSLLKQ